MESNSLDCYKMYNFYKKCSLLTYSNKLDKDNKIYIKKEEKCDKFIKNYIKKCNNFIGNLKINKLTFHDFN